MPGEGARLPLSIFLSTREISGERAWTSADAADIVRGLVADAAEVLAPCGLVPTAETARVIVLPADLFRFQGNERGSFGGHPPLGEAEPERFNYERNETLTDEARLLFSYGKSDTAPNTIAVYTVERVAYWIGEGTGPGRWPLFPAEPVSSRGGLSATKLRGDQRGPSAGWPAAAGVRALRSCARAGAHAAQHRLAHRVPIEPDGRVRGHLSHRGAMPSHAGEPSPTLRRGGGARSGAADQLPATVIGARTKNRSQRDSLSGVALGR